MSDISTPLSSTSAPSGDPTLPRKRCHEESSEHDSRLTASMGPGHVKRAIIYARCPFLDTRYTSTNTA